MKKLLLLMSLGLGWMHTASAQSFCASDGQPTPVTLIENFISADCDACWRAPQARSSTVKTITIDWIVPGRQGDDAPLSAAASRDAHMRLDALGRPAPTTATTTRTRVISSHLNQLRVAHGVALGGYLGASIELKTTFKPGDHDALSAWLVLIETVPIGAEGSMTEKNLVRNVLQTSWNMREKLSKKEQVTFVETRPLSIPNGATAERLRVVGWVQDARGRVLAAAQSVCAPPEADNQP